jgi:serine/threonine protein kinase
MGNNIPNPRWLVGRRLDGGGGGDVSLCFSKKLIGAAVKFMQHSGNVSLPADTRETIATELLEGLYRAFALDANGLAVVKKPKSLGDPRRAERVQREIGAMKAFTHPAMIKPLDNDAEQPPKWFVMEYHPGGNLADIAAGYKGKPLKCLLDIRPVVEGVAGLNQLGYVHRDIKPKNVFVGKNSELILGDFGIVFPPDGEDTRLTGPADEIVSRDWIPDWMRFTEAPPQPKADVFMLAKVIYFMVSGGKKVLASQIEEPDWDLRRQFADVPGIDKLQLLLTHCITTHERNCEPENAGELLIHLDGLINALRGNYQTQLIFSFYSSHSITNVPLLLSNLEEPSQYHGLKKLQIFLPRPAREFRGLARVLTPGPTSDVTISFSIDGQSSSSVTMRGARVDDGVWSSEILLSLISSLDRGLHTLDVFPVSSVRGGELTAFALYAG